MIHITNTAGLILDLDPKQVITVEEHNSLFNESDDLITDLSLPLNIPRTSNNEVFLGMGHLVEAASSVYVQEVLFSIDGVPMSAGNLRYRSGPKSYTGNLEPNLAAITSLLKGIRLPEIRTEDAITGIASVSEYEALMLDTVQNPDKYPFVFLPVHNDYWYGEVEGTNRSYPFINYFDIEAQRFVASKTFSTPGDVPMANTPYWKLVYILQQVAYYLDFKPIGDFFTDSEYKNLLISTRLTHQTAYRDRDILPSMMYMPNKEIATFLKELRSRVHIGITFNLIRREMAVTTFKTMSTAEPVDLSGFISPGIEQELPEKRGCTVTLKSDQQDKLFEDIDFDGNVTYPALYRLIAGDGEQTIELDCSTTKVVDLTGPGGSGARYPTVKQTVINRQAHFVSGEPGSGWFPSDISADDKSDVTTVNNWPLRLINYEGFVEVSPGKFYPRGTAYDLGDADKAFYRFINDARKLFFTAHLPPVVLSNLKTTDKYCHRTEGGNYINYLIEKWVYDTQNDTELVSVKFYARSLNTEVDTKVSIEAITKILDASGYPLSLVVGRLKAYFDPSIHGFTELKLEAWEVGVSQQIYIDNITNPCNSHGTGGSAVQLRPRTGGSMNPFEIRVMNGMPKYMLYRGKRYYFTSSLGYYSIVIDWNASRQSAAMGDTYTIFF